MVLAFEFDNFRYLTTGDAERDVESRLTGDWADELDADVYHVGHHASSTSSSGEFLDAVDPEIGVISSGFDNRYGHPADEVLDRFGERDIITYWTGVHEDIVVTSDGDSVATVTGSAFSTDPADLREAKPDGDDTTGFIASGPVIGSEIQAPG